MSAFLSSAETQRIVWIWRSNVDEDEWKRYSDIENQIIELAYQENKNHVELDEFSIDFIRQIEIKRNNSNQQNSIRRVSIMSNEYVRKERFVFEQSTLATKSFASGGGAFLPAAGVFMAEIDDKFVEKAANGIEEEGRKLGKEIEAKFMANELRKINEKWNKEWNELKWNKGIIKWSAKCEILDCPHQEQHKRHQWEKEICELCVKLYTSESFLYKRINQSMREAEEKLILDGWFHEDSKSRFVSEKDRDYGRTLGPYCWILQKYLWNSTNEKDIVVFRSANLTNEMIDGYKSRIGDTVLWDWFSSTTKNKEIALYYDGNTLFQIHIPASAT